MKTIKAKIIEEKKEGTAPHDTVSFPRYAKLNTDVDINGLGRAYVIVKAGWKGQIISETVNHIILSNYTIEICVEKSATTEISVNDWVKL